ncbi:MAG: hypothetical protein ABIP44_08210, partial [Pseudoxanthomonas sp.]
MTLQLVSAETGISCLRADAFDGTPEKKGQEYFCSNAGRSSIAAPCTVPRPPSYAAKAYIRVWECTGMPRAFTPVCSALAGDDAGAMPRADTNDDDDIDHAPDPGVCAAYAV